MQVIKGSEFVADRAWGSVQVANMNGITTKLHWTDEPYTWHVNTGEEVFVVLQGTVNMHYRDGKIEMRARLEAGDIFFADVGCEHVAYPVGAARVLVIEHESSM